MGVWHIFVFPQTSNSQMFMNIYSAHFLPNLHFENHLLLFTLIQNVALHDVLVCVRLLLHHGQCYYPENCPCSWLGLEYLPGESVETPCYKWCASSPVFYMSSDPTGQICCKIRIFLSLCCYLPAFVTAAISTAPIHHVQPCAPSTVTDIITPLMALNMTTTLTARSTCSK